MLLTALILGCAPKLATRSDSQPAEALSESAEPAFAVPEIQNPSNLVGSSGPQASGFVVHIDPLTGQIVPKSAVPPQAPLLEPQHVQTAPIEEPQFIEVPSPIPGGGVVVESRGQFRTPLVAIIEPDGKIKLQHQPMSASAIGSK
jgi:hypothetical protein